MKRSRICLLLLVLLLAVAGCTPKVPANAGEPAPATPETFKVTVINDSSYIFNELYVSPTAANDWGTDHLGSTSILKSNGSFDITLEKYEYENYDIRIIDQDGDTYTFTYVPLKAGSAVTISFLDGLNATVTGVDGAQSVISGSLEYANGDSSEEASIYDGAFVFTVYNESPYQLYSIHMSPDSSTDDSVDILPAILEPGASQEVTGSVADTPYAGETDWYLYVTDVDEDVSSSAEAFDPWLVKYVNVYWDSETGGYVCEFVY